MTSLDGDTWSDSGIQVAEVKHDPARFLAAWLTSEDDAASEYTVTDLETGEEL
jgi:hypothetical protein